MGVGGGCRFGGPEGSPTSRVPPPEGTGDRGPLDQTLECTTYVVSYGRHERTRCEVPRRVVVKGVCRVRLVLTSGCRRKLPSANVLLFTRLSKFQSTI